MTTCHTIPGCFMGMEYVDVMGQEEPVSLTTFQKQAKSTVDTNLSLRVELNSGYGKLADFTPYPLGYASHRNSLVIGLYNM